MTNQNLVKKVEIDTFNTDVFKIGDCWKVTIHNPKYEETYNGVIKSITSDLIMFVTVTLSHDPTKFAMTERRCPLSSVMEGGITLEKLGVIES